MNGWSRSRSIFGARAQGWSREPRLFVYLRGIICASAASQPAVLCAPDLSRLFALVTPRGVHMFSYVLCVLTQAQARTCFRTSPFSMASLRLMWTGHCDLAIGSGRHLLGGSTTLQLSSASYIWSSQHVSLFQLSDCRSRVRNNISVQSPQRASYLRNRRWVVPQINFDAFCARDRRTLMMNTQAQVAGPSRIPGTLPSKERLLMSTMKAGRILGEGISTSFLRLGEAEQNKDMQSGQVILNSPDNASPSLSPWDPSKVRSSISNSTRM